MNKWKDMLWKLLFPKTFIVFLLFNLAVVSLTYVFVEQRTEEVIAYVAYMIAFYTLVVVCARIPQTVKNVKNGLHSNKYTHRLLTDKEMRVWFFAYVGLIVNVCFAVFKVVMGYMYDSAWLYAMAGYHTLSSVMVFVLVYRDKKGKNASEETRLIRGLHSYEMCGWLMILMNTAISVIVFMVVFKKQTISYPGVMIYAIAAYSFYCLTMAIINLVKYRRQNNPVFSAIKRIGLAKALVSIFTMQVAMLTQFGGSDEVLKRVFNLATGSAVCALIMALAVFMLLGVRKDYKEVRVYGKQ
ncbi:MAG: hypothetical protein IJZ23_10375 [Roseburia sp.]|nr:hypothetical protein [Roseburia sp.]